MRSRGVIGVVLALVGAVWLGQGLDLIKGSFMTGQGQWAVIGAICLLVGIGLIGWDLLSRSRSST